MSLPITKIACLLLLAPLAMTSALPEVSANEKRCSSVTKDITYSSCTVCYPDSEPDCDTNPYYHDGESGGSCSDKAQPFNSNFCSTYGTLTTPFGQGDWKAADDCKSDDTKGKYGGTIVPDDGGDDWACSCVKSGDDATHNEDCGDTYACDTIWSCACTQCT